MPDTITDVVSARLTFGSVVQLVIGAFTIGGSAMAVKMSLRNSDKRHADIRHDLAEIDRKRNESDVCLATLNLKLVEVSRDMLNLHKDLATIQLEIDKHRIEVHSLFYDENNSLRFITYPSHDHIQANCHGKLDEIFKRMSENIERMENSSVRKEKIQTEYMENMRTEIGILAREIAGLSAAIKK